MCREGGGKGSPGVITLMNPGPYRPLYLWGWLVGGCQTNRPLPRGGSSRPMVARLVRYGPVRQNGGVLLTVGEIKEKKEKGKEGEGEKREFVEEMALI
jgi:hypothetical protein